MNFLKLCVFFLMLSCEQNNENIDKTEADLMEETDDTKGDEMKEEQDSTSMITFLALGDSYTIGERVEESEPWPVQLVTKLNELGMKIADPTIVARTGWTTDELQSGIESAELVTSYDFVSLLIGVNNQYRGYPIDQYTKEFEELLDQALAFSGDTSRTFVVSIPDYGVTPFGATRNAEKIAEELDEYNAIAQAIAVKRGVTFFNITPISREAKNNPALVAPDNLHPSGEMYRRWVDLIYPWAQETLAD